MSRLFAFSSLESIAVPLYEAEKRIFEALPFLAEDGVSLDFGVEVLQSPEAPANLHKLINFYNGGDNRDTTCPEERGISSECFHGSERVYQS